MVSPRQTHASPAVTPSAGSRSGRRGVFWIVVLALAVMAIVFFISPKGPPRGDRWDSQGRALPSAAEQAAPGSLEN